MSGLVPTIAKQDVLYQEAAAGFGPALDRLARAYELDPDKRRDLLQEIHFGLWRSLANYEHRCSLRTWIYRVAHNIATTYVMRHRRVYSRLVSIEELDPIAALDRNDSVHDQREATKRLACLIQKLKPLDRQVIVSYLEGLDAASTAEITGLSPANIAMKIHRIKRVLSQQFHSGASHVE